MALSSPVLVVGIGFSGRERAEAYSVLRYAILARLMLSPAPLHVLVEDLALLREQGFLPPSFTLRDILEELELYEALGLVREDGEGRLHVDRSMLPGDDVVARVENLMLGMTGALGAGLPLPPAGAEGAAA